MLDRMNNISAVLSPSKLENLIKLWLEEDCPNVDYGLCVIGTRCGSAQLLCKSPCVLAGVPFFNEVFRQLGCTVEWKCTEGTGFSIDGTTPMKPQRVAVVNGPIRSILIGERPALNAISRASGIATLCAALVKKANALNWKGRIAGTRKTTPGFRMVEKYALLVGGVDAHRNDLSSMVMLKDNHIWTTGCIEEAIKKVKAVAGFSVKIEVECQNLSEGLEAAESGADIVMFDNQDPQSLHQAANALKKKHPHVIVESSGGITHENITQYFGEDIDVISTSKVVQGYDCADFSLKIMKDSIH